MTTDTAREVGRLIGFGSQPKLVPGRDPEYRELVARYRNEPEFRDTFDRTAKGMGLEVLDCSEIHGLVLAADSDESPFHLRLDEFAQMAAEERHRYALVFLSIAAASYPRADALEDETGPLPQITVSQVVRFMNQLAARVADERGKNHDPDPPADEPLHQRLYQAIQTWADTAATADQRSHPRQKSGMVRRSLRWLAANGCADDVGEDAFRMRSRFRLLVLDGIGALPRQTGTTSVGEALSFLRTLSGHDV